MKATVYFGNVSKMESEMKTLAATLAVSLGLLICVGANAHAAADEATKATAYDLGISAAMGDSHGITFSTGPAAEKQGTKTYLYDTTLSAISDKVDQPLNNASLKKDIENKLRLINELKQENSAAEKQGTKAYVYDTTLSAISDNVGQVLKGGEEVIGNGLGNRA